MSPVCFVPSVMTSVTQDVERGDSDVNYATGRIGGGAADMAHCLMLCKAHNRAKECG